MSYFTRWWRREPIPASPLVGLNTHSLEPEHLDLIEPITKHVRWTIYSDKWEADEAYRSWNSDRLMQAVARGFKVLVIVQGYGTAKLAQEFPGVEAWQPLNEIDGPENRKRGQEYGQHLVNVQRQVPRAKLVAAGIAPGSATEFWQGMNDVGAAPLAYAVHIYGTPLHYTTAKFRYELRASALGRSIWCTEFGLDIQLGSELAQKYEWQTFIEMQDSPFQRVYGYALYTDEVGQYGTVEKHGIIRPDGSHRPTYTWLKGRI